MRSILSQSKRVFNATNSNDIISKSKTIFSIFFCISRIYNKLRILSKKRWASEVISFWNYWLGKAALLKCAQSPVSEHLWKINILNGPKHCLNPHGSIFVISFDHLERKSSKKALFLEVSEILSLFVNILLTDEKYSLSVEARV